MLQAIRAIGNGLSKIEPKSLETLGFDGLTREIARLVGANGAAVLLLDSEIKYMIHARALVMDGESIGSERVDCLGAPCQFVADGRELLINRGLGKLFPDQELLETYKLQAYVGVPMRRPDGKVFGVVAAYFRDSIDDGDLVLEVLRIAARLVGAELDARMTPEVSQLSA